MKTEPWGSHGGRRVARSASIRALPFRFCIFAMLAALLPLVAFAHSASAQTNTPAPARPRPHAAAPRPATAAQAPAMTPASPFPNPSPPVAGPATTAANPSMPPAAMPAPPADAAPAATPPARHRRPRTRQPLALTRARRTRRRQAPTRRAPTRRCRPVTPGRDHDQHRGAAAGPLAVGHVRPCRYHRESGDDRPRHRLAGHLDGLARQMARTAQRAHGSTARPAHAGELPDALSGPRAAPQRHQPDRVSDAGGRKRDPAFREPARRRPQGAHRLAARAHRAGGQPQNGARHRCPRHDRLDRALRRPVRHGLGHHGQLHRHLEGAHHQSRRGGAGHRRSPARDRARTGRRHPGGDDLQRAGAFDGAIPRAAWRRVRAGHEARQPRSRSREELPLSQAAE